MKRVLVLGLAAALVAFAAVRSERPEGQAADAVASASAEQSELDQPSRGDEAEAPAEGDEAAEEPTLEAMRRAWAERRAKIDSLYCEIALVEYVLAEPPGARRRLRLFEMPDPPSPEAEPTLTLEGNVRFWIAGEKMALRLDPVSHNPIESGILRMTRRQMTFDGTVAKHLDCTEVLDMGCIAREPWLSHTFSPRTELINTPYVTGVRLSIEPVAGLEAMGIDPSRMTLGETWTDAAGNQCLEIEIPSINPEVQNLLHVDMTRGYLPLRVERRRRGRTTSLRTFAYVEDPDMGWRIAEWTDSYLNMDYPPDTTRYGTVERFEVNRPIADEVFELVFAEGTQVFEPIGEEENAYYVAGPGGVLEPISEAEFGLVK